VELFDNNTQTEGRSRSLPTERHLCLFEQVELTSLPVEFSSFQWILIIALGVHLSYRKRSTDWGTQRECFEINKIGADKQNGGIGPALTNMKSHT
jgi:hypothetical protein